MFQRHCWFTGSCLFFASPLISYLHVVVVLACLFVFLQFARLGFCNSDWNCVGLKLYFIDGDAFSMDYVLLWFHSYESRFCCVSDIVFLFLSFFSCKLRFWLSFAGSRFFGFRKFKIICRSPPSPLPSALPNRH
jgi:hypothetical protein